MKDDDEDTSLKEFDSPSGGYSLIVHSYFIYAVSGICMLFKMFL